MKETKSFQNLSIPEKTNIYEMLGNIGKNLGYKATRGPLFTSTKKLELYSAQKEVVTHSGFVGVDMETGFLMEGLEIAVVLRAFSDQCEYILSLPGNKEIKNVMRNKAITRSTNLAVGMIKELGK